MTEHDKYLEYLTLQGAVDRFGDLPILEWAEIEASAPEDDPDVERLRRIHHELAIIREAGFSEYFLIVWDLMKYLREHQIPVGPGRGSVCGSLVAYCLKITDVDPLVFDIPFERFLHLDRPTMPDIDLDICQSRRQEALDYITGTYGAEKCAQIITFQHLQARGVVREVFRIFHVDDELRGVHSNETGEKLAKMIPEGSGADQVTVDEFMETEAGAEFKTEIEHWDREYKKRFGVSILDTIRRLEGIRRHGSIHAAGMVVADKPMMEVAPLYRKKIGANEQIQFDYHDAEDIGLLKLDVLGLRTVTVIGDASDIVRQESPDFDVLNVPLDDPATFEMLRAGDTVGVFQLEGEGMTKEIQRIQPTEFADIIAMIALYRPGPMDQIPTYAARKHGDEPVSYAHPDLEPILERTYGLIVFQEQVMGIAREMGGYSPGEADMFRKAIGKKIPTLINSEIERFTERAISRGYDSEMIEEIGNQIRYFGRYGFNLGHATGYGFITYWTAYLKANHPKAFYTATLNSYLGNMDRVSAILLDADRHDIPVQGPDINESQRGFALASDGSIRFGLEAVKGLGDSMVNDILEERDKDEKNKYVYKTETRTREVEEGKFEEYTASIRHTERQPNDPRPFDGPWDFCNRLGHIPINAKENLAMAGAFGDGIGYRSKLAECFRDLNKQAKKGKPFDLEAYPTPQATELEIMRAERDVMGFYVTGNPLDYHKHLLDMYGAIRTGEYDEKPTVLTIAGIVTNIKTHQSKNGEMAWLEIETGLLNCPDITCFNDTWRQIRRKIKEDRVIVVKGKKQDHPKFGKSVIADQVTILDRDRPSADKVAVIIPDTDITDIAALSQFLGEEGANVRLVVEGNGRIALVSTDRFISLTGANLREIQERWTVIANPGRHIPWADGRRLKRSLSPFDGIGPGRSAVWQDPTIKAVAKMVGGDVLYELEVAR